MQESPAAAGPAAPAAPQNPAPSDPAAIAPEPASSRPARPIPSDGEIQARVEEALAHDAALGEHASFQVKCEEGVVTLSGKAETLSLLLQAERRAGDIRGVLDVILMAGISTAGRQDSQILLSIQTALDVPTFRGDRISVAVMEGRVHLNGTTATYARKLLSERSAAEVPGVVSVQNNLRVVAPSEGNDAELERRVRLLLTGGLTPVPGEFEVSVKDREVLLNGRVPLYSHRTQAERLALSVGGIRAVQNRLRVDPTLSPPESAREVTP
jgi:osmotically-inducible protein OsmY